MASREILGDVNSEGDAVLSCRLLKPEDRNAKLLIHNRMSENYKRGDAGPFKKPLNTRAAERGS